MSCAEKNTDSQMDVEELFCSKVKELGCTWLTFTHCPALGHLS